MRNLLHIFFLIGLLSNAQAQDVPTNIMMYQSCDLSSECVIVGGGCYGWVSVNVDHENTVASIVESFNARSECKISLTEAPTGTFCINNRCGHYLTEQEALLYNSCTSDEDCVLVGEGCEGPQAINKAYAKLKEREIKARNTFTTCEITGGKSASKAQCIQTICVAK